MEKDKIEELNIKANNYIKAVKDKLNVEVLYNIDRNGRVNFQIKDEEYHKYEEFDKEYFSGKNKLHCSIYYGELF